MPYVSWQKLCVTIPWHLWFHLILVGGGVWGRMRLQFWAGA